MTFWFSHSVFCSLDFVSSQMKAENSALRPSLVLYLIDFFVTLKCGAYFSRIPKEVSLALDRSCVPI